jgi:hypothetical protein
MSDSDLAQNNQIIDDIVSIHLKFLKKDTIDNVNQATEGNPYFNDRSPRPAWELDASLVGEHLLRETSNHFP